ncbi:MAG: hypothetical protein GY943_18800, partial [Chloroflexi bacterium]|nr:hypothetical protein [Chloroflexota bacterium]
ELNSYILDNVPFTIMADCLNKPKRCSNCKTWQVLHHPSYPPEEPKVLNGVQVSKVREPGDGEFELNGSFYWWTAKFKMTDIIEE